MILSKIIIIIVTISVLIDVNINSYTLFVTTIPINCDQDYQNSALIM